MHGSPMPPELLFFEVNHTAPITDGMKDHGYTLVLESDFQPSPSYLE